MFKNINKIFAATILVAIALTSCTDESDVLDNKPIKNKKTGEEETIRRPYYQYEESALNDEQVLNLVRDFDSLLNTGNSKSSYYSISDALLAAETHFNYAIADKQTSFDTSISYDEQSFSFTIPIDAEEKIDVSTFRGLYLNFVETILNSMGNKYLQFSDVYVSEIDGENVTFTLEIPPYNSNYVSQHTYRTKIIRPESQSFTLPSGVFSDWNGKGEDWIDNNLRKQTRIEIEGVTHKIQWCSHPKHADGSHWIFSKDPEWLYQYVYQPTWYRTGDDFKALVISTMRTAYDVVNYHYAGKTPIEVFPSIHVETNQVYGQTQYWQKKCLCFIELSYATVSDGYISTYLHNLTFNHSLL